MNSVAPRDGKPGIGALLRRHLHDPGCTTSGRMSPQTASASKPKREVDPDTRGSLASQQAYQPKVCSASHWRQVPHRDPSFASRGLGASVPGTLESR